MESGASTTGRTFLPGIIDMSNRMNATPSEHKPNNCMRELFALWPARVMWTMCTCYILTNSTVATDRPP